jgi:hypothetical protein
MDVVFLIDATGSMSESIKAAYDEARMIADQLLKQSTGVHSLKFMELIRILRLWLLSSKYRGVEK